LKDKAPWLLGAGVPTAGQRELGDVELRRVQSVAVADSYERSIGASTAPVIGQWSTRAAVVGQFGGLQIVARASPIYILGWMSLVDAGISSNIHAQIADLRSDGSRFQAPGFTPGSESPTFFFFPVGPAQGSTAEDPLLYEFSDASGGPGNAMRWPAGAHLLPEPLVIEPGTGWSIATWVVNTLFECSVIWRKRMHPPMWRDL